MPHACIDQSHGKVNVRLYITYGSPCPIYSPDNTLDRWKKGYRHRITDLHRDITDHNRDVWAD